MNYKDLKEENTNSALLAGKVCSPLEKSHQVEGETFYEFKVEVERLSKIKDVIPVTVSERSIVGKPIVEGDLVHVTGEYRSYNKLQNEKSKLILHLFAKDVLVYSPQNLPENQNVNEVKLTGYICKDPIYRKTPFEREICDILLAVNRPNFNKSDYIPCILWGRSARFMANQAIGCKVDLTGRIQSREYTKTSPEGGSEVRTAYEISCQRISLSNISSLQPKSSSNASIIPVADNMKII